MYSLFILIKDGTIRIRRKHFIRRERVKDWPRLPTDTSKKTGDDRGGRGKKL